MMSRIASGAQSRSGSLPGARGYIAPANSILVSPGAPFKLSDIRQSAIDILLVIVTVLFACVSAVSIGAAFFILMFVRI